MKIAICSDLHTEFMPDAATFLSSLKEPGIDLAIFAGDIMTWSNPSVCRNLLSEMAKFGKKVLYVPGNHEYYGKGLIHPYDVISSALSDPRVPKNITVVTSPFQDYSPKKKGPKISCGTMWYPMPPRRHPDDRPEQGIFSSGRDRLAQWSDFSQIHLTNIFDKNTAFREGLAAKKPGEVDIVVTHMLPSNHSVDKEYVGDNSNDFFLSESEHEIRRLKPKLWIHGHTHSATDYTLGDTRVVCNPRGYMSSKVGGYKAKIVEIP